MTKKHNSYRKQKNGLIAMVHIAIDQLQIDDDAYRNSYLRPFGVPSSKAMSIRELEQLIRIFEKEGFVPKRKPRKGAGQARALRERVKEEAQELDNWEERLPGLVKSKCKVSNLEWCRDVEKLKQLLATIGNLQSNELESANKNKGGSPHER